MKIPRENENELTGGMASQLKIDKDGFEVGPKIPPFNRRAFERSAHF